MKHKKAPLKKKSHFLRNSLVALGAAAALTAAYSQFAQKGSPVPKNYTATQVTSFDTCYASARYDVSKRPACVAQLQSSHSELAEFMSEGKVSAVLYEPDYDELKKAVSVNRYPLTDAGLESSIQACLSIPRDSGGTICPTSRTVYAQHIPFVVIMRRGLFESATSLREAEQIVSHELQHVDDWYEGITIRERAIKQEDIASLDNAFLSAVFESRAHHKELKQVVNSYVEGTLRISPYIVSVVVDYFNSTQRLKNPESLIEQPLAQAQLSELEDITVNGTVENITVQSTNPSMQMQVNLKH